MTSTTQHKIGAYITIRANQQPLFTGAVAIGHHAVLDMETLLALKARQETAAQYRQTPRAMKDAKGFIQQASQLPMRYQIGCVLKSIVLPTLSRAFQSIKTSGEKK